MTKAELVELVGVLKHDAANVVRRHAALYARDVPLETVSALCNALGDVCLEATLAELDRLQYLATHEEQEFLLRLKVAEAFKRATTGRGSADEEAKACSVAARS